MLSYRHSFHAGNNADVVKHFVLWSVLDYVLNKPAAILYLDTHAGCGLYKLTSQNNEYKDGLGRLFKAENMPFEMQKFCIFLEEISKNLAKNTICGSAYIASKMLREQDSFRACELHHNDFPTLKLALSFRKKRTIINNQDGFKEIKAALPCPSRRAIVFIDPPYEDKSDYLKVKSAINHALSRLKSAVIIIWYPLLGRIENKKLSENLISACSENDYLDFQIEFRKATSFGMYGCGMFVVNPPYSLEKTISNNAGFLVNLLGDENAKYILNVKNS